MVESKSIGELLLDLKFSSDDYKDLVIDIAYGDLIEVRSVYSAVSLNPEDSNMVRALNPPPKKSLSRLEQLVERLRMKLINTKKGILEYDCTKYVEHLPPSVRTSDSYLSHSVPESLREIVKRKLEPLNNQLNQNRQILESGRYESTNKNFQKTFNEYVVIPAVSLFYFILTGEIPQISQSSDRQRNIDNAYLKLKRHFNMMFTDALVLQYFEDFHDENSFNYKYEVKTRLELARIYKDIESKSQNRHFLH